MGGPVVITGGGTGGHVFPMAAVAEALRARGVGAERLRFVGSRRGQEGVLLAGGDVALTLLPGRGLRRSARPRDLVVNLAAAAGLVGAALAAATLVRRWRPSVVVSVGGYASFAVSLAAVFWRVPLVLVEFDAAPGAAQRLLRRYAARRCCAFPSDDPRAVVTGAPLREAIELVDRTGEARDRAKRAVQPVIEPERTVVIVMTGSLGSTRVNDAASELAAIWASRNDLALVHVTGRRDYARVLAREPESRGLDYRVVEFADMVTLWGVCDVAVCRAGAITVAELTCLAIPSVLVPLPGAPGDHQTKNAQAVVRAGGARLVSDGECTGATLAVALEPLLDPDTRATMAAAAGTLGRRHAAAAIAEVVLATGGGS
jgi:UDP-N-acetylglucosamine:LPS N-acetylglucosamine transferase